MSGAAAVVDDAGPGGAMSGAAAVVDDPGPGVSRVDHVSVVDTQATSTLASMGLLARNRGKSRSATLVHHVAANPADIVKQADAITGSTTSGSAR